MKPELKEKQNYTQQNIDKNVRSMLATIKKNTGRSVTNQEIQQIIRDARKQEFLRNFMASGGNIAFCCAMVGVSRSTYLEWRRSDENFLEAVTEANEAALDMAEQQLLNNILAGKETSLIFFLCNKGKERGWTSLNKMENKVTVPVQINVEYADDSRATKRLGAGGTEELPILTTEPKEN